jgi:hypothetical protein
MKALIGALAVLILMIGAPSVMAFQAYWTPYDDTIKDYDQGLQQYHMFLDGTYPSSIDRSTKLVNQDLSICLQFPMNHRYVTPVLCHQIKESDIPQANDSIVDAGYFVVPAALNETAATACIGVGYRDMGVWCNGETTDGNSASQGAKYLGEMGPTYEDVQVHYACLTYHHLKEGTQAFYDCEKDIS